MLLHHQDGRCVRTVVTLSVTSSMTSLTTSRRVVFTGESCGLATRPTRSGRLCSVRHASWVATTQCLPSCTAHRCQTDSPSSSTTFSEYTKRFFLSLFLLYCFDPVYYLRQGERSEHWSRLRDWPSLVLSFCPSFRVCI